MTSEEIKRETDIIGLFKEYGLNPDRKGFVCCPFHSEKTASMKLYPNSNTYHCFGCGANGDVFNFVQTIENCDFKTAFIRLGGIYQHQSEQAKIVANSKRERAKKQRELKEKADAEIKQELSIAIEIAKQGINILEPFSDEWCQCQNYLPVLLEYWEQLSRGEEINRIDVHRKCREIRCYFNS